MNLQRTNLKFPQSAPKQTATPHAATGEVCRMMADILGEGVDVHRCLAAQALGRIGKSASVAPLIKALLDEDEDVRTDVAEALSKLPDPRAGKQLLENLLGDPCTEVKLAAIETLAQLQDKDVIPWLRRIVKGRDPEIVWDEDEFYASGWDDWVDVQVKAVGALSALNAVEAVPDIVEAMQDENAQDMTEAAFKALGELGQPGIDALAAYLDDESPRLRRRAAAILATSSDEQAYEPVSRALTDSSVEVRISAMRALAARAPADDRLAGLFEDSDEGIRVEAVRLFGKLNADRLQALLADEAEAVQIAVLEAMETLPASDAMLEELRAKLTEGPAPLAAAVAKFLGVAAPVQMQDDLIELLGDVKRPVETRLGALQGLVAVSGEGAVRAIIDAMYDDARPIRLEAMATVARIARTDTIWPNAAGTALMLALSRETSAENDVERSAELVKAPAVEAVEPEAENEADTVDSIEDDSFPTSTVAAIMDHAPEAKAVKALQIPGDGIELTPVDMERLAIARNIKGKKRMALAPKVNPHDDVRRFAARVLGDICRPDVASALASVLDDSDKELRMAAADSLTRIGEKSGSLPTDLNAVLLAAAASAEPALKLLLIRALAACDIAAVGDALKTYLNDDDSFIRAEAIHALCKLGQFGAEIEALLGDPDSSVRLSAAKAIAGAGAPDAVGKIVDFAFSFEGYHGVQAARLLRRLDVVEASGRFMETLRDPEQNRTWSVAINALAELNASQPRPAGLVDVNTSQL